MILNKHFPSQSWLISSQNSYKNSTISHGDNPSSKNILFHLKSIIGTRLQPLSRLCSRMHHRPLKVSFCYTYCRISNYIFFPSSTYHQVSPKQHRIILISCKCVSDRVSNIFCLLAHIKRIYRRTFGMPITRLLTSFLQKSLTYGIGIFRSKSPKNVAQ